MLRATPHEGLVGPWELDLQPKNCTENPAEIVVKMTVAAVTLLHSPLQMTKDGRSSC